MKQDLMRHQFSGDPWGPCSRCEHPQAHAIHYLDQQEEDEAVEGARKQLEWMEYMDRLAQEELGARPRSEVIVELPEEGS